MTVSWFCWGKRYCCWTDRLLGRHARNTAKYKRCLPLRPQAPLCEAAPVRGHVIVSSLLSGEEERHPASELNRHEPTVRGWQSTRSCKYPQELVLRLHKPAAIRRVQVLAHQCLIREYAEEIPHCRAQPREH